MVGQITDSTARGQHALDWVKKCLTGGHVWFRPGLTAGLNGLTLQDVVHALHTAKTPGKELPGEHWSIQGQNVDGIRIEILVSIGQSRLRLLSARVFDNTDQPRNVTEPN